MKSSLIFVIGIGLLLVAIAMVYNFTPQSAISSYEECIAAGYPSMESYPPQCRIPNGTVYVQNVEQEVPYDIYADSATYSLVDQREEILTDYDSFYNTFIEILGGDTVRVALIKPLDFNKSSMVVIVGPASTGGDYVVKSVTSTFSQLFVDIEVTSPGEGCVVAQVISQPYVILEVPSEVPSYLTVRYTSRSVSCSS